jgi:exodeoxyribonuclease VII large subunit
VSSLFDLPFEEPEAEPIVEPLPVPRAAVREDTILTVTALSASLRGVLESQFSRVSVEGELSNCRTWNTGHLYFTLKDEGAQIRGVMFRSDVQRLKFRPEDGQHVVARGRVTVYEVKGEYQIVCDRLEPHGVGALQLAFEQLKGRLAREGLFDAGRKRPVPALPRRVGVVTSLDGAAVRDIVSVLSARYPGVRVLIRPARVQGDGAAPDIARALNALARVDDVDVIIVGRGGGSIEDLWAFNEETVARAIANSPVPVISAVGHETDFTIADFVADVRAATPSAAAGLVAAGRDGICTALDRAHQRLDAAMHRRVLLLRNKAQSLATRPARRGCPARVALRARHVSERGQDLARARRALVTRRARAPATLDRRLEARDLRRRAAAARARIAAADAAMAGAVLRRHHAHAARFGRLAARLDTLSPLAVLGRGYAVCWNEARKTILRDATDAPPGTPIRVVLARGSVDASVTAARPPDPDEPS